MSQPVEAIVPRRTTWPQVLGIIGAILGGLAVFGYGCLSPVWLVVSSKMADAFEEAAETNPGLAANAAQMRAMEDSSGTMLASNLTAAAIAVLLLVGGYGLVKRRAWSRPTLLTWAVLRAIYAVPALWIGWSMQTAQMEAMREGWTDAQNAGNTPMPTGLIDVVESMTGFFMVLGLLWAWALPVFVLVWFNRRVIKEEVLGWR